MKRIMLHITILNILYIISLIIGLTDIFRNDTMGFKTVLIVSLVMIVSIGNIVFLLFKTKKAIPYYKTVFVFAFIHLYIVTAIILAELGVLYLFVIPHVELVIYLLYLSEREDTRYNLLMLTILGGSFLGSLLYMLLPNASYDGDVITSLFGILLILHIICCSVLALIRRYKSS